MLKWSYLGIFLLLLLMFRFAGFLDHLTVRSLSSLLNPSTQEREQTQEIQALLNYVKQRTRISLSTQPYLVDQLPPGQLGRYNPILNTLKIQFQPDSSSFHQYRQRWTILHELGHAVADSTHRIEPWVEGQEAIDHPQHHWTLHTQNELPSQRRNRLAFEYQLKSSPLVRDLYAEHFADVFALALSLSLDSSDPMAYSILMSNRMLDNFDSVSLVHDTQSSLHLAFFYLSELKRLQGPQLLGLIDSIASRATFLTLYHWGALSESQTRFSFRQPHHLWTNPYTLNALPPPEASDFISYYQRLVTSPQSPRLCHHLPPQQCGTTYGWKSQMYRHTLENPPPSPLVQAWVSEWNRYYHLSEHSFIFRFKWTSFDLDFFRPFKFKPKPDSPLPQSIVKPSSPSTSTYHAAAS